LGNEFYDDIAARLQGLHERAWDSHGMLVLDLQPSQLLAVVDALKGELGFSLFLDVTAIDWLGQREPRFDVVYHFLCPARMKRVRLKVALPEDGLEVPTLVERYGSARFMEREVHEMYGVRFAGNADLRPILLYEGFEGHPLRKDYPMELEQPIVPYRT
jgi:NADH-quinone oxidoreductase subunit C